MPAVWARLRRLIPGVESTKRSAEGRKGRRRNQPRRLQSSPDPRAGTSRSPRSAGSVRLASPASDAPRSLDNSARRSGFACTGSRSQPSAPKPGVPSSRSMARHARHRTIGRHRVPNASYARVSCWSKDRRDDQWAFRKYASVVVLLPPCVITRSTFEGSTLWELGTRHVAGKLVSLVRGFRDDVPVRCPRAHDDRLMSATSADRRAGADIDEAAPLRWASQAASVSRTLVPGCSRSHKGLVPRIVELVR